MTVDYLSLLLDQAPADWQAEAERANLAMFEREAKRRPFFRVPAQRASAQVTELSSAFKEEVLPSKSRRQLADLGRFAACHRNRDVLDDAGKRHRKYEIETGIRKDGTIGTPLEPWTAPGSRWGSMYLYGRIMHADPGTYAVTDFAGAEFDQVHWMAAEGLVEVDGDLRIHPLSDAAAGKGRMYPGASCSDKFAAVGSYLRDKAVGLVSAALYNLCVRPRKGPGCQPEMVGEDGVRAKVAQICAEANRVKSVRSDLIEYRYLSVTRCAEIIRALIETGFLDEIEPARFERRFRSWRAVSRVIGRMTEEWDEQDNAVAAMYVAEWDAGRRKERAA